MEIKTIAVTGATGFVAGWIVKSLLEKGITVHAPVRDPEDESKVKYLRGLDEKSPGTLKLFKADLLEPGSYDRSFQGCDVVIHTASPFTLKVNDPQKQLVDPALTGTKNVIASVNRAASVKKVVLTSSCASIYGDNKDLLSIPNGTIDESHWNTTSSLKHQAYSYSKTVAEKEAWRLFQEQSRWKLAVINPSFVLGPGINPYATSESFNVIKQMADGTMKAGVPDYAIGAVDVRDVAKAHVEAAFREDAEGRHIVSARTITFLELGKILRAHFGDNYPFPQKTLPKFLVWLVAPLAGMKRKMVSRNMGYPFKADHSKSKKALGMEYRPVENAVIDMVQQMIDTGVLKQK